MNDAPAASPRPAKTAANDRIVIGFVIVSAKIEAKAPGRPGRSASRRDLARPAQDRAKAEQHDDRAADDPQQEVPGDEQDVIAVSPNAAMPA